MRMLGKLGPAGTAIAVGVLLAAIATALVWLSLIWLPLRAEQVRPDAAAGRLGRALPRRTNAVIHARCQRHPTAPSGFGPCES